MQKRKIAVITARADERIQKDIICGICEAAFAADTNVMVFSNIENHWFVDDVMNFENIVYSYFEPSIFDGAIITGEAFMDLSIISDIIGKIKAANLPCIVIGKEIEGFDCIFLDDDNDLEAICDHLIDEHGITDIDFMTGPEDDPISNNRINGCRRSFEKHGLCFDENRVFYGTFWYAFGEEMANKYLSGGLRMPKAVICANDCMANSLCEALLVAGVNIPDDITITGYDSIGARVHYYPVLTTYQSDRRGIGVKAVNRILSTDYRCEQKDRFVAGNTCKCGVNHLALYDEICHERLEHPNVLVINYSQFSSPIFSRKISLCRNLWEYIKVLNDYFYINDAKTMLLCLDSEWNSSEHLGEEFICCKVDGSSEQYEPYTVARSNMLMTALSIRSEPSVYFFYPLVFQTRLYGFAVLAYDDAENFKHKMRNWSEIVSNGLELLRLKNDIHYLTLCQKTSSTYDSLTGFCKMPEFRRSISNESGQIIAIKIGFASDKEYAYDSNRHSDIISSVALGIKHVCNNREVLCRTDNDEFLILCQEGTESIFEIISVTLHRNVYIKYFENPPIISMDLTEDCSSKEIKAVIKSVNDMNTSAVEELHNRHSLPQYDNLTELRKEISIKPQLAPDIEDASKKLCVSEGYFRAIYKKCFGISYVQDCINEKIILAKFLLCTTVMSVYSIAVRCGYSDDKYFARQFHQCVGCSPAQYRKKYCGKVGNL